MRVGFVGAGNMGGAIIKGLIHNKTDMIINVSDFDDEKLNNLKNDVNLVTKDATELITNSDIIVLAIKPHMYKDYLTTNKELLSDKIVVSIAAGISSTFMQTFVNKYVLVMPNLPASIGQGLTSIAKNETLTEEDFKVIETIFNSIGECTFVKEDELELMICMAGSSPAYFDVIVEAMALFAQKHGMEKDKAEKIAASVMNSSSQLIMKSDVDARQLAINVSSPNGTTERAVKYFDNNGLADLFDKAMQACYDRAVEMKRDNDESVSKS